MTIIIVENGRPAQASFGNRRGKYILLDQLIITHRLTISSSPIGIH